MYSILFGVSILKSLRPFFKKNVLKTIDEDDFLYLNTFFIGLFVILYFIYSTRIKKNKEKKNVFDKYKNLKPIEVISMVFVSLFTVISTVLVLQMDKGYQTPFINAMLTKGFSTILVILIGMIVYKENYTKLQMFGIGLILLGTYFISSKK
jgi:drug/metabolite transporter (DMT)-like permease